MTKTNSRPRASIIIRTFNEAKHIGRLLKICFQQIAPFDFEIIVVDSGSTDGTLDIIRSHNVQLVSIAPEDFSFGRSLNLGVSKAMGEYCVIISAHCFPWDHLWLAKMIEPFANPKVAMVYGKQRGSDVSKYSEQQIFLKWFPEDEILETDFAFCNNANSAIRKELWNTIPFDESLMGLEDMAWAKEVIKKGFRLSYKSDACVDHIHEETYPQIYRRYFREALAYRQIYPHQSFSFFQFVQCLFLNVVSDSLHAIREKKFMANLTSIIAFRYQQFWATYRGQNSKQEDFPDLKRRLYFPRNPRSLKSSNAIAPNRSLSQGPQIFDISRSLNSSLPVWPGSKSFELKTLKSFEGGHGFTESEINLNIHTGTHADAPLHFVNGGKDAASLDLNRFIGNVLVVAYNEEKPIDLNFLKKLDLHGVQRILFKTKNSSLDLSSFDPHFIGLTAEAAEYLCQIGIKLVGVDGPSVQLFHDTDNRTHEFFLRGEVAILEGLFLRDVVPGVYVLFALPLKISSAEGAPTRAILIKKGSLEAFA